MTAVAFQNPEEAIDPMNLFEEWLEKAKQTEINEPGAMALATISKKMRSRVRMVLLKTFEKDTKSLTFCTNLESDKAQEIFHNPNISVCFHWKTLGRQVRIEAIASRISEDEADLFFKKRLVGSQIGAWASKKSRPLDSRETFSKEVETYRTKFEGAEVPRPPHWGGFRLKIENIEFWEERPFRLHERLFFIDKDDHWEQTLLYP